MFVQGSSYKYLVYKRETKIEEKLLFLSYSFYAWFFNNQKPILLELVKPILTVALISMYGNTLPKQESNPRQAFLLSIFL